MRNSCIEKIEIILNLLKSNGSMTRGELVSLTGMPRTTIYDCLVKLWLAGKVKRFPVRNGKKGRPKVYWKFINFKSKKSWLRENAEITILCRSCEQTIFTSTLQEYNLFRNKMQTCPNCGSTFSYEEQKILYGVYPEDIEMEGT